MRLIIAAVGRLKDGAERDLYDRYAARFDAAGRALGLGPIKLAEIGEARSATPQLRKADEAQRLLKATRSADVTIALEERGRSLSSEAFAQWIAERRDGGAKTLALLIGGPDGHGEAALKPATLKLSLGTMTLPHGLARVVVAEQLYRAATILAGHPYHRA
jgi:23S rRNA (pseudouridine1915-N3)-methyltransferase